MTKSAVGELTVEREFPHSQRDVFRAWTQEEALRKWMGPGEITAPESRMDARVGGSLTIPMLHADGTVCFVDDEAHEHHGKGWSGC